MHLLVLKYVRNSYLFFFALHFFPFRWMVCTCTNMHKIKRFKYVRRKLRAHTLSHHMPYVNNLSACARAHTHKIENIFFSCPPHPNQCLNELTVMRVFHFSVCAEHVSRYCCYRGSWLRCFSIFEKKTKNILVFHFISTGQRVWQSLIGLDMNKWI